MRDPKGMKVQDMFPMLFEETDEPHAPDITEEEAAALQAEMDAWNWANSEEGDAASGTPDSGEAPEENPEENPDNSENAAE
jgi:hypothetical protein